MIRKDLYYRLGVMPLTVPPLRERQEEITSLALQLLGELAMRGSHGRSVELSVEAQMALWHYKWPGNVRELPPTRAPSREIGSNRSPLVQWWKLPSPTDWREDLRKKLLASDDKY